MFSMGITVKRTKKNNRLKNKEKNSNNKNKEEDLGQKTKTQSQKFMRAKIRQTKRRVEILLMMWKNFITYISKVLRHLETQ